MAHANWIKLRNNKKIALRPIQFTDVEERHEFFVKLSMAQVGMVHTVDEIEIHTHETHDQIFDFLKNKRGLWLVAVNTDKKIVGEIDITVKNLARVRHNGALTMGILEEWRGIGLGTLLMEQALLWCEQHKILRVELSVFDSNIRAQSLYERFGFVVEGRRKNFIFHQDNNYEDDVMMAKYFFKSVE